MAFLTIRGSFWIDESVAPTGAGIVWAHPSPRLTPWATICRPCRGEGIKCAVDRDAAMSSVIMIAIETCLSFAMFSSVYLEITFHRGKPLVAYVYLPREPRDSSDRADLVRGCVIDRAADGRPIGIELTSPRSVTLGDLNHVLAELRLDPLTAEDLSPLAAA